MHTEFSTVRLNMLYIRFTESKWYKKEFVNLSIVWQNREMYIRIQNTSHARFTCTQILKSAGCFLSVILIEDAADEKQGCCNGTLTP